MRKTIDVLNVPFDDLTMEEATSKVISFMGKPGQYFACTPNPEIVMVAQKDEELMNILKAADLVVPDGIGVVLATKLYKEQIKERVAGFDLVQNVFSEMQDTEHTVYFLGGDPGVAKVAAKKMIKMYPNLKIVGTKNGYFKQTDEKEILSEIRKLKPTLLLVGLGAPRQEKWIYENLRFTNAKICIGVGGSFDVMAGYVKRAPTVFRKLGLEWFYRLLCQPKRFFRMLKLPQFALVVIYNKLKGK